MAPYEQFLLFGDSITQEGHSQDHGFGFAAALQDAFIRRLDVINRGFSGYNSTRALWILPQILPSPSVAKIRFITIFFGPNDARLPDTPGYPQHVPLEKYRENLKAIISHADVVTHDPKIILITPGPIDERLCEAEDLASKGYATGPRRLAETTRAYAEAAKAVGQEVGVPVLDLWTAFMERTGWKEGDALPGSKSAPQNEKLGRLLRDGLHFTPEGYQVMYDELMRLMRQTWPEEIPEHVPFVYPSWDDATFWDKIDKGNLE